MIFRAMHRFVEAFASRWAAVLIGASIFFAAGCDERQPNLAPANEQPEHRLFLLSVSGRDIGWVAFDYENSVVIEPYHGQPIHDASCPIRDCLSWPSIVTLDPFNEEPLTIGEDVYRFSVLSRTTRSVCGRNSVYMVQTLRNEIVESYYLVDANTKALLFYQSASEFPHRAANRLQRNYDSPPHTIINICTDDIF